MSLFNQTDALSQAPQGQRMTFLHGKELIKSAVKTLMADRSEDEFRLFFDKATQ